MFCRKCGKELKEENIKFCPFCGAEIENEDYVIKPIPPEENTEEPIKKNNKSNKGFLTAIIVLAAIVIISLLVDFAADYAFGRDFNEVAEDYVEAIAEGDSDDLLELLHNKYKENIVEQNYGGSRNAYISDLNSVLQSNRQWLESKYGRDYDCEERITAVYDILGGDLEQIKEIYDTKYDIDVSKAKSIDVSIVVEQNDYYDNLTEKTITVIKSGNSWYLANTDDISFSFFDLVF